jgi:type III pantothenate kinase
VYLAIDIGNTLAKYALFDAKGTLLHLHKVPQELPPALPSFVVPGKIVHAIFSTVSTPPDHIADLLHAHHIPHTQLDAHTPLPFVNNYATPHTLGNDRRAIAAAAVQLFPQKNVLVISSGTCITYNVIDNKKTYIGGAISPGMMMRYQALHTFTQKLPHLTPTTPPPPTIAHTTTDNIQSGVQNAILYEMQGYIAATKHIYPQLIIIFTGGDAHYFENRLNIKIFALPNLALSGLFAILTHKN